MGRLSRRPVLVVSGDRYNASNLKTVTVVALTSNARLAALPGNVIVPGYLSELGRDSVANVTQIVTLDRAALEERVARLPLWVMALVSDGIRRALAL